MIIRRRLTAAIGVGALALLGAAAFAGPASADTTGGNAPGGPYTLTITKLQNPPAAGPPRTAPRRRAPSRRSPGWCSASRR